MVFDEERQYLTPNITNGGPTKQMVNFDIKRLVLYHLWAFRLEMINSNDAERNNYALISSIYSKIYSPFFYKKPL